MLKVKPKHSLHNIPLKNACLGVSLNSSNHTDENLSCIIDFINQNFESLVIDLSDTLYARHFMSSGISHGEAYTKARSEGDLWIHRNKDALNNIKIPYKIIRWDYWLAHSDFDALYEDYMTLFDTNDLFQKAVIKDIQRYYKRRHNINVEKVSYHVLKGSIAYLIEEITCHTIMARAYPNMVNVYPGKQLECYKVIQEQQVENAPKGLENLPHLRLCLYDTKDIQQAA